MSLRNILAAIAALIAIALIVDSWLESRADRAQLQSTLAAQQQVITAAESRERVSAAALKTSLDQIANLKRQVQTPQQVVSSLPQYLPLPQPITLAPVPSNATRKTNDAFGAQAASTSPESLPSTEPAVRAQQGIIAEEGTALTGAPPTSLPDSPNPRRSASDLFSALKSEISKFKSPRSVTLPPSGAAPTQSTQPSCPPATASGDAEIREADLKPLYDYVQDCRACQAQLAAANANLKDEHARSTALTRERDAAVTAAKGGGFWRQLKRNAKWLTIGAAAGVVLSRTLQIRNSSRSTSD